MSKFLLSIPYIIVSVLISVLLVLTLPLCLTGD